ncbi:glycerol dehydrogenase [Exilibacterium tricleocarpae]|uniref:Glycerol dehydrogenase n=1 Tax=Exilibacterium tricleocarpae TaxID=2591008 RepID=A0A545TVG1_9GAMM|nr:glycerol dehydrogenase [Exilibacterium tricleocarpae]TQV81206.1 glycerol dehydrogenase [Exilibacterium tricleocarpae]
MITTSIFPGRYVQGDQALDVLAEEAKTLGERAVVIADKFVVDHLQDTLKQALADRLEFHIEAFGGECSDSEIERLGALVREQQADIVIGVGGGKTLDTAKAVAYYQRQRVLIAPTLASTDAPCSALSVIYNDDGSFNRYLVLPHNPDIVLVDTAIVAAAPVRLLVAGMGDAFATWFEAEDCRLKRGANMTGRVGPMTAYALAHLCHETLLEYGTLAKLSCEENIVTPALEHIVEANTLLSGLGFESGGLAAAHAIHNGLTTLEGTHSYWHGEKVAIGIQAMMFLADKSSDTIDLVYDFSESIGLPTTLGDIGLPEASDTDLLRVAETACAEGETIHNEPVEVTPRRVLHAIKAADAEGRRRKKRAD